MDTLAGKISEQTYGKIVDVLKLEEVGAPYIDLNKTFPGPGGRMFEGKGSMRIWKGGPISKMVYVGYAVEDFGVDSHMIFAFTNPESIVPTFTLDSVFMSAEFASRTSGMPVEQDTYAFHMDLVPRVELAANYEYMKRCYHPIEEATNSVLADAEISPAVISQTQRATMSPWMLANRSTAGAYERSVFPAAGTYLDHWLALLDDGLEGLRPGIHGEKLAERDQQNRNNIFSREIDPVWERMDRMIGKDRCEHFIEVLRNQGVEGPFEG